MVRPNTEGYELERDEIGFYDWEQRPADEVLGEMRAKGLDISSYQEMVGKWIRGLSEQAQEGIVPVNEVDQQAALGALIELNELRGSENHVELFQKHYFPEQPKLS